MSWGLIAGQAMLIDVNAAAFAPGSVCIVGAGPGAADLLTLRALQRIQEAEVVVHDRFIAPEVLALVPSQALRVYVGKALGDHAGPQQGIHTLLIKHAHAGRRVVRLKAGDPCVFGRGGEEVRALQDAGIVCEVVPGVTAAGGCAAVDDRPPAEQVSNIPSGPAVHRFSDSERDSLHRVIEARRDMRHFSPGAHVGRGALDRLLRAAHHAPSVGLMQPWRFIRITDAAVRERIAEMVEAERLATAVALGGRADEFLRLKVEGVRDCAELLVAALAPDDGTIFGRRTMPQEMAICSLACAVQNLWLAARAENLGLGWVSMFDPAALARLLHMPGGAKPLAVLCLGPADSFYDVPLLEAEGWRKGLDLGSAVFEGLWGRARRSEDSTEGST